MKGPARTLLVSAAAAVAASSVHGADPYVSYDCTVELTGAPRPMFTEKEMKRFDESFAECMEVVSSEKPEFEYIEVESQTWTDGDDIRREMMSSSSEKGEDNLLRRGDGDGQELQQRRLGSCRRCKNEIVSRTSCRKCDTEILSGRRMLQGDGPEIGGVDENAHQQRWRQRRLQETFDQCMKTKLTKDADEKDELEAFHLHVNGTVGTACSIVIEGHLPPVSDVLGENSNGTAVDETSLCTTELQGASTPMLSEKEMAHFDNCMIAEYNAIYGEYLMRTMIENEIVSQDPEEDLHGTLRRRLLGGNKVMSKTGSCRKCYSDELAGRKLEEAGRAAGDHYQESAAAVDGARDRRLLIQAFNDAFCGCLRSGSDHHDNETYPAFAGISGCTTACDDPVPSINELQAQTAETASSFELKLLQEKTAFDDEWKLEEEVIRAAEAAHKQKKDRFNFEQKEKELKHKSYLDMHERDELDRIRSSCVVPAGRVGKCDGLRIPTGLVTVNEANTLSAKFDVNQKFAYNAVSGKCSNDLPGYGEVEFLARYVKDEMSDGRPVHECKEEAIKCGETKTFEAKKCYWDNSLQLMVADIDVAINRAHGSGIRRKLIDDTTCQQVQADAMQGLGNYCYLSFKIDCNCQSAGI